MIKIFILLCSLHCILSVHAALPRTKKSNEYCSNDYTVPDREITNFTALQDYSHQMLRRQWDITGGSINLVQEYTNSAMLTWRKHDTEVYLSKHVTSAIDQKWQFGRATITISISVPGAIDETWNLGDKSYHYTRSVTGVVTSKGNANSNDLVEYKRKIDCWCQANYRFFLTENCIIYKRP